MNNQGLFVTGIGVGAGLMYVLDPDRGARRRAGLRDQFVHTANKAPDLVGATVRDIRNRAQGLTSTVGSLFVADNASDEVMVQRVRSKLGRIVSHPHAINVSSQNGRVTLAGPIIAHEVDDLIGCVSAISGVTDIVNKLEDHNEAGNISALQGGQLRKSYHSEFLQENWSPAARVCASATGAGLVTWGLIRREPLCLLVGTIGLGLLARGLTNMPVKRLVGAGAGRRAVELQKTINIDAPVEQVYKFWKDFQNFPRFMSNVREVRTSNGRSHWVVAGPAGVDVEWDAHITKEIPNQLLSWKSEKGSTIESAGLVRFMPNEGDGTSIEIKLSYNPPAGAVGHGIAKMLGIDPKAQMDEDLMRMKTLIETGNLPHDAAHPMA
jgi:uncharacterized membrane protein